MVLHVLILLLGVYACSTAVIMIKATDVDPVLLAAYRQLIAAAALSPLFVRDLRRHGRRYRPTHLLRAVVPGLLLGAHFISWIIGARMTPAANSSLIVNMVPVAMPFLLHFMVRERLTRGEWLGTALAVAGVAVLAGADYGLGGRHFLGDVICLGSMVLFAAYLALGRRNRDFPTVWLYLVPLYFVGGAACFLASLARVSPAAVGTVRDVVLIFGLGLVPTVIGHSILNASMKHLRGQSVSIANLGQFLFAGIMAAFCFGEIPTWPFYLASVLLVAGCALAILGQGAVTRHQ